MSFDRQHVLATLFKNINQVLIGKPEAVRFAVVALLAEGHILIEDVPGVGKTLLARAISRSIAARFNRIQFTPDLLPSDVIGSNVFNRETGDFVFHQGPIFANVVLADEINRTTPRTQSALLEAMNDQQVSVDGQTYRLSPPFMVLATQNPFEFEGTYLLPESQLDRFMLRIGIGYPSLADEKAVLASHRESEPIKSLEPVLDVAQVCQLQQMTRAVTVEDSIGEYILRIVTATRQHDDLQVGVSPRGALSLQHAAQGLAITDGRDYVIPDDVKTLCVPVLAHRVLGRAYLQNGDTTANEAIIQDIIDQTSVPD